MIFYFSGTGNSKYVANQVANLINDKIISINHFLKNNIESKFKSENPLIFVVPTYAWRIPKIVEQWLRKSKFEDNKDAYFILTCGDDIGNAGVYVEKLCVEAGLNYRGTAPVIMPENYLALFPTPDESQCQLIIENAKPQIQLLAELIKKRDDFPKSKASLIGKFQSRIINPMFYPLIVKDKGFTVSKDCISCNKCAENCPLNNVELILGKPVWKGNCTHCMACIACCPTKAIEYKNASKGRHRHYIVNSTD